MNIPLNATVTCSDGEAGRSSAIIVDPATNQVTHVVVKGSGALIGEYLAPIAVITQSTPHELQLSWTRAELANAERFDQAIFLGDNDQEPSSTLLWPYAAADETMFSVGGAAVFVQIEQVPGAGLAVHVGAHVDATDGRVGQVDEFVVDHETSAITHLVLRHGHLWGKHEITVPISAIDHVADDVVYLNLDKAAIEDLGRAPKA